MLDKFLWGAATSSHQIEGNNIYNDWWAWEQKGAIEGGVRSSQATDHWNLFEQDLNYAQEINLNSYRFSIEWSRIEPEEGTWNHDALSWYKNLVLECKKRNLTPFVTLHHFTLPQWLSEKGGLTHKDFADYFLRYAEKIVDHLSDEVSLWCTFNEPMVLTIGSYLGSFMPPAMSSPQLFAEANHSLLKAHVMTYDLIHQKAKTKPFVSIAHNMMDFHPDRKFNIFENIMARFAHRFYNQAWLDAVTGKKQNFGIFGLITKSKTVTEALGRKTVDFLGINYYTKGYVQWKPHHPSVEGGPFLKWGVIFAKKGEPHSDLDWAIHPQGLKKVLKFASSYGLPMVISENGIADRTDKLRGDFLYSHLQVLAQCREQGLDIRGYFYWSLLDNFEWIKGFKPRFGLCRVNYDNFERELQPSGVFYRKIIEAHQEEFPSTSVLKNLSSEL